MTKVYKHVILAIVCLTIPASFAAAQMQFPMLNAEDVKQQIRVNKKVLIVDARTPDEYITGHIPGAVNIPPDRIRADRNGLPKDKSTPIIFYCRGAG